MGSELTTAETGLELPLDEPHFDDEATVLSARPVVPLDEVPVDEVHIYEKPAPSRFARGWVFAATVAGAMLLGAVVAIAYFSYANRQPVRPAVTDDGIVAGVEGLAIEPTSDASAPAAEARSSADSREVQEAPVVSQPVISSRETTKPVARRVAVLTFPSSHEERKEARRLAKQQRKEMERESRNRNLTRIREIFEGPQRP